MIVYDAEKGAVREDASLSFTETESLVLLRDSSVGRMRLKCEGTPAETRFRLSAKRASPFKSARGRQFS